MSGESVQKSNVFRRSLISRSLSRAPWLVLQYCWLQLVQLPSQWSSSSSSMPVSSTSSATACSSQSSINTQDDIVASSSSVSPNDHSQEVSETNIATWNSRVSQRLSSSSFAAYYGDACYPSIRLMTDKSKGNGVGKKENTFEMLYSISSATFTYSAAEDGPDFVN